MRTIEAENSLLLLIDFQARLMPAIEDASRVIANARRLCDAAGMFKIPLLYTEQNPKGLGTTVEALAPGNEAVMRKMTFDASLAEEFTSLLPSRGEIVVAGCEAHICVLQTVLGLLELGRKVFLVRDAIGSRRSESKEAAIARLAHHGAEIVTTEMVVFEWLGTAEHPRFREAAALIK